MNILVAVNEAYLKPLSVMLYSLQIHNPTLLEIYILHLNIPEQAQKNFRKTIKKWKKKIVIHFIKIDGNNIRRDITYGRFGIEAVLRLALLKVLPLDMERILWIDADVIIRGNIQRLYRYKNLGQYAVVCEDMFSKREKYKLFSKIGMKMTDKYFNSGIMLFYLHNLRNEFDENAFFQWIDKNPDKINFPDQNALNVCLKKKLCWVKPEVYNLQLLRVDSRTRGRELLNRSKVFHYNTNVKPWEDNYQGVGEYEFWKYGCRVLGITDFIKHYSKKIISKLWIG